MHRDSRCLSPFTFIHIHGHLSVSPRLDSPFLFLALPSALFLLPVPQVRGKRAHSAKREYGLHRRVLPLHSGREQNSAMYHTRGNTQWGSDQLHVRSEKWL